MRPRVLVIGQGPAGLTVASLLAHLADVTIVSASQGTLGLFSATLDFMGRDRSGRPAEDPYAAWADGTAGLGEAAGTADWPSLWGWLARVLREAGIPYPAEPPSRNSWVISASGTPRPTYLVPGWVLSMGRPSGLVFLGMPGLSDTPAPYLAHRYSAATGRETLVAELDDLAEPWDVMRWAGYLDRPEGMERFLRAVRGVRAPRDLPWVMPGILGIRKTEEILDRLADDGIRLLEMTSVPPAVAGVRLDERWRAFLRARGVMRKSGRVVRLETGKAHLADGTELRFDGVIRATGGVLGGGLRLRSDFVAVDDLTGQELGPVRDATTLARLGIADVTAAGADRGGMDPAREGCGMGAVLLTAYQAARTLQKRLGLGPLPPDMEA